MRSSGAWFTLVRSLLDRWSGGRAPGWYGAFPSRSRVVKIAGAMLLTLVVSRPGSAEFQRVPCKDVVSLVTRHRRSSATEWFDVSKAAEKLGTSNAWVEHCLRVYGRRYKRPGLESAEKHEKRFERYEIEENEEPSETEQDEPGELDKRVEERPAMQPRGDSGNAASGTEPR